MKDHMEILAQNTIDNICIKARSLIYLGEDVERYADNKLLRLAELGMSEKLAEARANGRGGWWDSVQCSTASLKILLAEHLEKGDMRDVMNLAAMVYVRGLADTAEGKNEPINKEGV